MAASMPPQSDDKPVLQVGSVQRPFVEGSALQVEKMVRVEAGPGIKPILGGTRNSDALYVGFVSAISAQSSDTLCYTFTEAMDYRIGPNSVPAGMWRDPPPLIAELMGQAPTAAPAPQGNLLQQLQQRRAAPKRGRHTSGQLQ